MDLVEKKIRLVDVEPLYLFGPNEHLLQMIENKFSSTIAVRGDTISIRGNYAEVNTIARVFDEMQYVLKRNGHLEQSDVRTLLDLFTAPPQDQPTGKGNPVQVILNGNREAIKARTGTQVQYISAVMDNDIVFAIGPAGTGKTYLAVAMAVSALKNNEITRIILARPAVEAGESLGFLPGDLSEKIDPYLRPLFDALADMITAEKLKSYIEKKVIEIVPLAYMRGRTLNNAFVILDEAQNATAIQMKMFLTRLGSNAKAIVTGDVTQIDLPPSKTSGLIEAQRILQNIDGIGFVFFEKNDVVRHKLVMSIIDAYDKESSRREKVLNSNNEQENLPAQKTDSAK